MSGHRKEVYSLQLFLAGSYHFLCQVFHASFQILLLLDVFNTARLIPPTKAGTLKLVPWWFLVVLQHTAKLEKEKAGRQAGGREGRQEGRKGGRQAGRQLTRHKKNEDNFLYKTIPKYNSFWGNILIRLPMSSQRSTLPHGGSWSSDFPLPLYHLLPLKSVIAVL